MYKIYLHFVAFCFVVAAADVVGDGVVGVGKAYRVEHDRVDARELLKEHQTKRDSHRLQVSLTKNVRQFELSFAGKLT